MGEYEIRVRASDDKGNMQPEQVPFNEQGYLYGAVVGHPVRVSPDGDDEYPSYQWP